MGGNPNPRISGVYSGLVEQREDRLDWTGEVRLVEERMDWPLHWQRPRRVFVSPLGDIFHESLSFDSIDRVFAVMMLCPQHAFIVLTKRADRLLEFAEQWARMGGRRADFDWRADPLRRKLPPNTWLGVSVEDQAAADARIPLLLATPAAHRLVSCEPLLGPIDLTPWLPMLDWTIVGSETGPGARPCDPDWLRGLRDQCVAAGVPFWLKQTSNRPEQEVWLDDQVWHEAPADLDRDV